MECTILKSKHKHTKLKTLINNGIYVPRTTKRIRAGYYKHRHEGCCVFPRYAKNINTVIY